MRSKGGWVTPGDEVCVVDTELGRIGMVICFDGDYPELARIQAVRGAQVIVRPSALLRSADIWELTCRARAYDNHVYVIGANATGIDPGGLLYFGNSLIVTPVAEVVARAATHECWVSARLDPDRAMVVTDSRVQRPAGLRPPGRPQPRPDPALRRRPAAAGPHGLPAQAHVVTRRIRIGIDTGGTFTDVVAVDEQTGELATTKTPSTPADPAEGFMTGVHKSAQAARPGRRRGGGGESRHHGGDEHPA